MHIVTTAVYQFDNSAQYDEAVQRIQDNPNIGEGHEITYDEPALQITFTRTEETSL